MQTGTNFSESFTTVYEDELSFLEKTVNEYPASALSLFLLLQNYKKTGNEHYDQLVQKAAVYFPNHTWLNYQLSGDESMNIIPEEIFQEAGVDEPYSKTEDIDKAAYAEPEKFPEHKLDQPEETTSEKSIEEEAIREMEKEEKVEFVRGEEAENIQEIFVNNEAYKGEKLNTEPLTDPNSQNEKNEEVEIENKIQQVLPEQKNSEELPAESFAIINTTSTPEGTDAPDHPESLKSEVAPEKENDVSSSSTIEEEPAKSDQNQTLEFEPLHTIDYFASQGIIIREEALMNDKLGKQMKSFTDWLKSMKKLHPGKLPEQNEVVEKIIQSSAELSNEDAGILTETMADVLIKQGKKGKAIEMFEKLSLMNPSKSIYFAAKIESLKTN